MTPQQIRETVRRYAFEHGLLKPGGIVVAVSGGVDSTALLLLLADLASDLGLVLHVAHFDHRIRRTGAADAQFVSDQAARVGATIRIGRAETPPKSEDDARRARYAFLERARAERRANAVATGHTRDDQAETVLLHLTRGAGVAGLGGMRPSREGIVRPLLCIGRAETAEVCRAAGIAPREDPTNRSLRYARNRIRRKVLPELAAINPQVTSALARIADAAADIASSQRDRATALLDASTKDGTIDLDALGMDEALREEALAIAWERATGHVLTARHRAAVAAQAARSDGQAALDLPGGRLIREHRSVRIERHKSAIGPS
jgi:tRNA(Ile)-lysidine synthase